jgi:preprotein translocase subunit YajC
MDQIFNILLLVVLAVLVFFMFRNSRKRKAEAEALKGQMVPGAEVMTNFGLFGTLLSTDEVSSVAELEVSPGNVVRVHRQTLARVVKPEEASVGVSGDSSTPRSVEEAIAIADREEAERLAQAEKDAAEPEFGERIDPTTKDGSAKKVDE